MDTSIALTVNGRRHSVVTDPQRPLLEVLREDLGLTGVKCGCGEGQCGACTVLLGDQTVHSCTTPVIKADRQDVLTIEGLAAGEDLHPVQKAFLAEGALQCGYCTPGMIMSVVGLLRTRPHPTRSEIMARMTGHICRCGGYTRILTAIERAAGVEGRPN